MTQALLLRNEITAAERRKRELRTLALIGRRFTTSKMISSREGWHERSVQRYARALCDRGLITLTKDTPLVGGPGSWFMRYALTDAGKRAIAAG